jgi:hypothetical protein
VKPGSDPLPMGARLRLAAEQCERDWKRPQSSVIVEAMCTHGLVVIDSSDHFKLSVEASNKWDPEAADELGELHLSDFELIEPDGVRGARLWESALSWANQAFGTNPSWGGGWYEGAFWGALLKSSGADPDLADVLADVNSADWLTTAAD